MILVLNFKTYFKSIKDYLSLIKKLPKSHKIWLALNPYFYLILRKNIKEKKFKIGLQNLGPIAQKPQTGEVIYEFELINKADFVLLGHSERYRLGENTEIIKEKIRALQEKKIKLLIFFSENSYDPKEKFSQVLNKTEKNLKNFISVIDSQNYEKIYFVYEPWWAISTEGGKIPSKNFLEDFLNWYRKKYKFPILYGGSYNSEIAKVYQNLNFDGYVLGKASTSIGEIKKILDNFNF